MQLQVQVGRCQSQPTDAAPCSYGCCWWHSAGTRDHECQRHSASGSAVAAAWTAAQSKAAARQPRSDSTAYIDTPAPAFKSAAPTPQARLLASSRCLLVAAAPTAARRRLHRTAASTRPPMCPQSCTYGCTTRPRPPSVATVTVTEKQKQGVLLLIRATQALYDTVGAYGYQRREGEIATFPF